MYFEYATAVETAEFVGSAGRTGFILRQGGTASNSRMLVGSVLGAVDFTVADPLDGDAASRVVAAEFVFAAHLLLTLFRFICKSFQIRSNQVLTHQVQVLQL